jgi:hypothetical protein
MIRHKRPAIAVVLLAVLGGCDNGPDPDVLAVAEDHQLTIEHAARLLANQSQLPNRPEIVEALADLWIDYTLIATASVGDSLLEAVDLSPLVRTEIEQEMVYRLRDQVIQVDTLVSDEELTSLWAQSGPGGEVRARHILLSLGTGASDAERDSVRALAEDLKRRAERGEDFSALAREYSQDRGSAELGGDLGTFGRGDMVGPFEAAAFALETGEISDPVETIYGYHVILVDEKHLESLDDNRVEFLAQVRAARVAAAESVYVASVEEPANVEIRSETFPALQELARRPGQRLGSRAAARPVATFDGGEFTVGEFQEFIQARPPAFRSQIPSADSSALDGMVRSLARAELLVNEAERQGFVLGQEETDSIMERARSRFGLAVAQLGLRDIAPAEGQTQREAIAQRVNQNLGEILQGQRDVIPLGVISYALRTEYRGEWFPTAVPQVVERVESFGGNPPPVETGAPAPAPAPAPNAPPPADSSGSP